MTAPLKIGVVGICQIHGFGLSLAQLLPEAQVRVFEAPIAAPVGRDAEAADYLAGCDVVFSHPLAEEQGALWTPRLRERIPALRLVPLIVFAGWHPDMSYVHHHDKKLPSPVGAYHSAIVATAYSLGYGADEAELLFNRFVFAKLGYFDQYAASWSLMFRDLEEAGYAPHLRLDEWCRDGPFMHGINHPKIGVLARIARAAAILAELAPPDSPVAMPDYDWLACDTIWPVYPEIAKHLGVAGSYGFKPRSDITAGGIVPIVTLPEFIRQNYELYRSYPAEAFACEDLAPVRAAFESFLPPPQHASAAANGDVQTAEPASAASGANGAAGSHEKPEEGDLLPTEAAPAAKFIVRHMYRSVDLGPDVAFSAVPETAHAVGGDTWFWTDDNAKVLEFLSRPELWAQFPEETADILQFVRAMCHPPFIFRRLGLPRIAPADDGGLPCYHHSLLNIRYDLARGGVIVGMRFHDARNFDHLLMSGNMVEFTWQRRRYKLPVEAAIDDTGTDQDGPILKLWHASTIRITQGRQALRVGRLTYRYTFDARSVVFDAEVRLEVDPDIEISDVVLTIGHDHLGQRYYDTVDTDGHADPAPLFTQGKPGEALLNVAGSSYYVIRHGPFSGDALAIHAIPQVPTRFFEIEVSSQVSGQLNRVMARYSFAGPHRGVELTAAEHKLLTGGGFYDRVDDYAGLLREAAATRVQQQTAYDFSISYDYGVVINAFAKCFAACALVPELPEPDLLQDELRPLIDTYLQHFMEITITGHRRGKNTIFSRELGFMILAAVTMYRATGAEEYRLYLLPWCETLLDLERQYTDAVGDPASGFIMKIDADPIAHVDCHSTALLALVRAAEVIQDDRLLAAIDRGLAGFCLVTDTIELGEKRRVDSVATLLVDTAGVRRYETPFWNFKAGLTLRLFAALNNATEPALQALAARHRDRLALFETILRRQLVHAITWHDDAVEFRCSTLASETNSETQPWVMLGLIGHPAD